MIGRHDHSGFSRAEQALLRSRTKLPGSAEDGVSPIFILAAPRTGSTLLFQLLAASLDLPYLDNLTNECFAETPLVGLALHAAAGKIPIDFTSRYGKTEGPWQPSEASNVMRAWFGGGHPSELVSSGPLPGKEEHILATFQAARLIFDRPLLIKNAWNCFRIPSLRALFPHASFIWVKRDIGTAAASDLAARYVTKGDPDMWNSATPRNYDQLRKRPYWEQVVENQFEFTRAISDGLMGLPDDRQAQIWYEDLCRDFGQEIRRLAAGLACLRTLPLSLPDAELVFRSRGGGHAADLQPQDAERIRTYVEAAGDRFAGLSRPLPAAA